MKFARTHLQHVMNLDFNKPSKKIKEMAMKANIDLNDPIIIDEFKAIQQ